METVETFMPGRRTRCCVPPLRMRQSLLVAPASTTIFILMSYNGTEAIVRYGGGVLGDVFRRHAEPDR